MTRIEQIKAEIERLYEKASESSGEYRNGAQHTLITLKEFVDSLPQEPQGLDEAAEEYANTTTSMLTNVLENLGRYEGFKAGAMWDRDRIINKAAEWIKKNLTFMHPRKEREVCMFNIGPFKDAMMED